MALIKRTRGDTYSDEFVFLDRTTKQPLLLVGCSFLMTLDQFKEPVDSSTVLYQLTGVILNPTNGRVLFTPSEMQADQVGKWYYDIQMTDGFGGKRTLVRGSYKYKQDITK